MRQTARCNARGMRGSPLQPKRAMATVVSDPSFEDQRRVDSIGTTSSIATRRGETSLYNETNLIKFLKERLSLWLPLAIARRLHRFRSVPTTVPRLISHRRQAHQPRRLTRQHLGQTSLLLELLLRRAQRQTNRQLLEVRSLLLMAEKSFSTPWQQT